MASILAVQVISLFPIKAEPSMTHDSVNIFNNILWMGLCNGLNGRFCDCVDVAMRVAFIWQRTHWRGHGAGWTQCKYRLVVEDFHALLLNSVLARVNNQQPLQLQQQLLLMIAESSADMMTSRLLWPLLIVHLTLS